MKVQLKGIKYELDPPEKIPCGSCGKEHPLQIAKIFTSGTGVGYLGFVECCTCCTFKAEGTGPKESKVVESFFKLLNETFPQSRGADPQPGPAAANE